MRIDQVLSPTAGLFSAMPQDIWGDKLDPSLIDIEVFTRIGGLTAGRLVDYYTVDGVLATDQLATLIYQKYQANWKRMWQALEVEYNIMLTSSVQESRVITTERDETEDRDLLDIDKESTGTTATIDGDHNVLTETEKRGEEKRKVVDGLEKDLTSTDKGTVSDSGGSTDKGTVMTDDITDRKGSGVTKVDEGVNGPGAAIQRPTDGTTTTETPNFRDELDRTESRDLTGTQTNIRTDDLIKTDGGTETRDIDDTTSFVGRKDLTSDIGTDGSRKEEDVTVEGESKKTGTIGKAGDETVTETFKSEGSSPLRTYQALIQEEIEGRSGLAWNFTELVISNVQSTIALNIWKRDRCG